ncbi:MAG: pyridoxamine 5'-phosphate oxidase family protein [Candidatus Heimdallarchaeota archaeon]|nr:pyridoxamine 5'-phosphate oxidase family protein [Candidatus Heimdallarchaeota archaeon]MCK4291107.1 pyridoxamine 5'-phosphate oxidase family protein [Candidatus Heimdallarchaeota archaeon]
MSDSDLDSEEAIIKMREEPPFDLIKSEILTLFAENKGMILGTSLNDRVTARHISFVNVDFDIYFTSWEHNKKIIQMKGNPNIALCLNNVQIEGKAEFLGWAFDKKYNEIGDLFRAKFSSIWFDRFSHIKEMMLIKIAPVSVVKFENIYRRFQLQNIDIKNKKVYQMRLEDKNHPKYPY